MPKTGPDPVNRLGRFIDDQFWKGWDEADDRQSAKEFAAACRANGARARAIRLPASTTWHGALARFVIYVPKDQTATEVEIMRKLWDEMFG